MKLGGLHFVATAVLCVSMSVPLVACASSDTARDAVKRTVDQTIEPLMAHNGIHGMAVGIVVEGHAYVFDYGLASVEPKREVNADTLFEIGSVSKTFTATLTSFAREQGALSLSDPVGKYLPELRGSPFGDDVTLLNLGTHTTGGLPLQVPDDVQDITQLMAYFKAWKPAHAPGTFRTYANPSIGTLGLIAAKSEHEDFDALMKQRVFPSLGMKSSFLSVPAARMKDYAQGYTKDDTPIRMKPGVLASEAYGVRTTARDMTRFLQINMSAAQGIDPVWQRAAIATHTAYFQVGPMTQDLIWEQYPWPAKLDALQEGNAPAMIVDGSAVTRIDPPQAARDDVWINKTGATNGFGAYIAFVPAQHVGIVMLANRNYPNSERVAAAYSIVEALSHRK